MGLPSIILFVLLLVCWRILPDDGPCPKASARLVAGFNLAYVGQLLKIPQLWVVLAIAFSLYIMRETFNDWTVDFFQNGGGPQMSVRAAAMLSTAVRRRRRVGDSIAGLAFDGLSRRSRTVILVGSLTMLAVLINYLPALFHLGMWEVETAIALIGFLSYGPYSLLAGVSRFEIGGKKGVGTVAGMVDQRDTSAPFRRAAIWEIARHWRLSPRFSRFGAGDVCFRRLCLGLKSRPKSDS